ncbi:Asp-tRNA(Asn)/Glu-tRNA(Gln) amidotransferase GatCAB subunit B [Candidatus Woesearchaeota archaeon]|nr:Asp-tRNA(Asn)/Glu-tRNA(Gln) amidotransferase GatCAB subunit B [Candidatus Woesearchaeota archaeon]|tara:strand:- start:3883 stop:5262 length:1380 start_codon:yes stop_codon:yes gene_type:complete
MVAIKIGLEVHGYLHMDSKAKLFCDCKLGEAEPNTNICPICTGMPGSKPMPPNKEALDKIISIAGMLDCRINKRLLFQRKHYDWPDMPTGFQRTMSGSYSVPVGEKGNFLSIGITEVHLEEDPARWQPDTGYVDYNRSGFPLVEIVTEPDFDSAQSVREWLKKLVTTLSYIKAIDADAGLKSDVNVSIGPDFNRVEIKNVNSFKSIIQAIEYEVRRQQREIKEGKSVGGETRAWNDAASVTVFMRKKEKAMDYMFIPEPDLPVINVSTEWINKISSKLPEKPAQKIERYIKDLKIDKTDAEVLSSEILLAEKFEKVVAKKIDPVLAARWFRRELMRVLNYNKKELHEIEADEKHIVQLLKLVESKKITDEVAKRILEKLIEKPFDVDKYVESKKLAAVSDTNVLEKYCKEAISENEKAVEDYKAGNEKAFNFIVGSVMRKSKGKATPQEVNKILKKLIE